LLDDNEVLWNALDRRQDFVGRIAHQVEGFMKIAVRVDINGQDALAANLYRHRRGAFGCARAAFPMPQLQKAISVAAAPFKKLLRVVIRSRP
jgi:hypothetical protein